MSAIRVNKKSTKGAAERGISCLLRQREQRMVFPARLVATVSFVPHLRQLKQIIDALHLLREFATKLIKPRFPR
jgi:hypothetical protein